MKARIIIEQHADITYRSGSFQWTAVPWRTNNRGGSRKRAARYSASLAWSIPKIAARTVRFVFFMLIVVLLIAYFPAISTTPLPATYQ
mgnify:CR=1 FL=1